MAAACGVHFVQIDVRKNVTLTKLEKLETMVSEIVNLARGAHHPYSIPPNIDRVAFPYILFLINGLEIYMNVIQK